MTSLYLNISSDKVHLSYKDEELFLERNSIEETLGKVLIQWYRTFHFTQVCILNGPGGFTNLRVGSLCVNLLNTLVGETLDFFSVSKIDLYQYIYAQGKCPKYGCIYIGQKRNVWLWDFEKREKVGQYTFEQLEPMMNEGTLVQPLFLDMVYDTMYYPAFLSSGTTMLLDTQSWKGWMKDYVDANHPHPTKHITANYMIAPNIGN